MGTWGTGSFDNDDASIWIDDLAERPTYDFIKETFQASLENRHDVTKNQMAIAAAEVIAIINGHAPRIGEEFITNLASAIETLEQITMPGDIVILALKSIEGIEDDSELKELWGGDGEWLAELDELKNKLKSSDF
jgi:Domain of unknown function (DUF4259)